MAQHLDPLQPVAVVALIGGALALGRRPLLLLGLCLGTAPFLLALNGIYATNELRVRFLSQVLPPLAVWLGVGLSGSLGVAWQRTPWRRPGTARIAAVATLALGLLLVLGIIPSPVSPVAPWRAGWMEANAHVTQVMSSVRDGPPPGDHCATRMKQEQDAGQDAFRSALYGREAVR